MPRYRLLTGALVALLVLSGGPIYQTGQAQTPELVVRSLPAALPIPSGEPDDIATLLAAHIAPGGPEAMPALLTALELSGIGVAGMDGAVLITPPDRGQSIMIQVGDLWAALDGQGEVTLPLLGMSDAILFALAEQFGPLPDDLTPTDLATNMLETTVELTESADPAVRFWARFIVGLGWLDPINPVDLTAEPALEEVQLSSIQFGLITLRFAADLMASDPDTVRDASVQSLPLGGSTSHRLNVPARQTQAPCMMDGTTALIYDQTIQALGYGRGKVLDLIKNSTMTPDAADRLGKYQTGATILLAYVKLIFLLAGTDVDISMDGGPQLVRTKGTDRSLPGEPKLIRFNAEYDFGGSEILNCFRISMVAAGLDFSLPNSGPISGGDTQWSIVKGGGAATGPTFGVNRGYLEWAPLHFQPTDPHTSQRVTPLHSHTDAQGQARIVIAGKPQERAKSNEARPYERPGMVKVVFVASPNNLRDDILSLFWQGLGGISAIPAMVATLPVELITRSGAGTTYHFPFTVIDWHEGPAFQALGNITFSIPCTGESATLAINGVAAEEADDGGVTGVATVSGDFNGVPLSGDMSIGGALDGDTLVWFMMIGEPFHNALGIWAGFAPTITPLLFGIAPAEGGPGMWLPFFTVGAVARGCPTYMGFDVTFTPLEPAAPPRDAPEPQPFPAV